MTAEEILKKVNECLDGMPYDRKPYSLYEPVKYVLSIGGKRIRPEYKKYPLSDVSGNA